MQSRHDSILSAINSKRDSYKILTAPTHERYQSNLSSLKHTFYMLQQQGNTKPWNFEYAPVPKNHILLSGHADQIKNDMMFDIVLSQNKFGQAQLLGQYANQWNTPWINIEHTWPMPQWTEDHLQQVKDIRADFNVFISEQSCVAWGWDLSDPTVRIIRHGVDTNVFSPDPNVVKKQHILTVANDYINRDWCLGFQIYKRLTEGLPTRPVGDTPGFSEAASDLSSLISEYRQAGVFLNTSTFSPIPTALLEAAACGCPIVTNDTCACGDLIQDGINGFISKDEDYLKMKLKWCLEHPKEASEMGMRARETVLEKFSLEEHLKSWNSVINEAYGSKHDQW